jgi:hypothetical protein
MGLSGGKNKKAYVKQTEHSQAYVKQTEHSQFRWQKYSKLSIKETWNWPQKWGANSFRSLREEET